MEHLNSESQPLEPSRTVLLLAEADARQAPEHPILIELITSAGFQIATMDQILSIGNFNAGEKIRAAADWAHKTVWVSSQGLNVDNSVREGLGIMADRKGSLIPITYASLSLEGVELGYISKYAAAKISLQERDNRRAKYDKVIGNILEALLKPNKN
jgi:hypothetical protein